MRWGNPMGRRVVINLSSSPAPLGEELKAWGLLLSLKADAGRQQAWRLITEICRQEDQKVSAGWWHRWEPPPGVKWEAGETGPPWKGKDVWKGRGFVPTFKRKKASPVASRSEEGCFCYRGELGRGSEAAGGLLACSAWPATWLVAPRLWWTPWATPSPRAPLASVEVLVPQSSLQVAGKMGCNGHSANSNPSDKSSVVWGLPDQKVQTGIKTPDK